MLGVESTEGRLEANGECVVEGDVVDGADGYSKGGIVGEIPKTESVVDGSSVGAFELELWLVGESVGTTLGRLEVN